MLFILVALSYKIQRNNTVYVSTYKWPVAQNNVLDQQTQLELNPLPDWKPIEGFECRRDDYVDLAAIPLIPV